MKTSKQANFKRREKKLLRLTYLEYRWAAWLAAGALVSAMTEEMKVYDVQTMSKHTKERQKISFFNYLN